MGVSAPPALALCRGWPWLMEINFTKTNHSLCLCHSDIGAITGGSSVIYVHHSHATFTPTVRTEARLIFVRGDSPQASKSGMHRGICYSPIDINLAFLKSSDLSWLIAHDFLRQPWPGSDLTWTLDTPMQIAASVASSQPFRYILFVILWLVSLGCGPGYLGISLIRVRVINDH